MHLPITSLLFFPLLFLAQSVISIPTSKFGKRIIHEKRDAIPTEWRRSLKLREETPIPLRIALRQSNLHNAESYLLDVSHPDSPNYGRHWTPAQVAEAFAPSSESVSAVKSWLMENNIGSERIHTSQSLSWLYVVNATVGEVEALLGAEYFEFVHNVGVDEGGMKTKHFACESYSLPEEVRGHVDFVTPTVHFDAKVGESRKKRMKRGADLEEKLRKKRGSDLKLKLKERDESAKSIGQPGAGSDAVKGADIAEGSVSGQLAQCDEFITLDCLRTLYQFENPGPANKKNTFAVVEYTPQAFLQADLNLFFANYSPAQVGNTPIFDSIDGGVAQTTTQSFNDNGESDLDLEYAMGLAFPQKVNLYQVGDLVEGGSFNNFLDALDASYCTFDGGDDPTQDATYPDPLPGGFKGPENCGGFTATKVISTSYSHNENSLTPFYLERQCNEFLKLGLMGVTSLYSSGDRGVAGRNEQCTDPVTGALNNGSSGLFTPSFPGTCPFITSVGATQVSPNNSVFAPEAASAQVIFSGGGFSNVFATPSYQAPFQKEFFKNHLPPYTSAQYNTSQNSRGYPDVAANGVNYVVYVDGVASLVFGTSCSTPVFSSILSVINQERLNIGKSVVGFVNPVLYAHPEIFNDITLGDNPGCGTNGFEAVDGWDPVTGLGTPNFPKMLEVFLSLP